MADADYKCVHCAAPFVGRKRMYCGNKCSWVAVRLKRGQLPLDAHRERIRNPANHFNCIQCGVECYRRLGGNHTVGSNKWCSHDCQRQHFALERQAKKDAKKRIALLGRIVRLLYKRVARDSVVHTCIDCGAEHSPLKGRRKAVCAPCTEARRLARRALELRLRRLSPAGRAAKKKYKTLRRMREKVEAEAIDPIAVFERDGWRCQLCGIATPKRLKGSNQPNAPELDHVMPLALKGTHTWANVQCACRVCNGKKGAKALCQLGLALGGTSYGAGYLRSRNR